MLQFENSIYHNEIQIIQKIGLFNWNLLLDIRSLDVGSRRDV